LPLGPVLYLLFISDLPEKLNCTIATFADDTAILTTEYALDESSTKLQRAADDIATWTRKWRIKLKTKQTPWPLVRERTIPTERPPFFNEI
jgi:hypothetical protein